MGDLIKEVGNYELILNDMDEKANASKGTYVPGRNMTVGALNLQSSNFDPYYQRQEETEATQDYEDISAVKMTGKPKDENPRRASKRGRKEDNVDVVWPSRQYTYNVNLAHEVLDDLIDDGLNISFAMKSCKSKV